MSTETDIIIEVRSRLIAAGLPRVYDMTAPQNQAMPYVVLGGLVLPSADSDNTKEFDATLTIHTWSDGATRDRSEVANMQQVVYDTLHRSEMRPQGVYAITQEFQEILIDPDQITRHGVQRFRFNINTDVITKSVVISDGLTLS